MDVYDPARLERRLRMFETICLPGIRGQTDKTFRLGILAGEKLPVLERLRRLASTCDQIELFVEPEGRKHLDVCRDVLYRLRPATSADCAEFCMDDDDAVNITFVSEVRRHYEFIRPMLADGRPIELDFCRGYAALHREADVVLKNVVVPHWTPAQVLFIPDGSDLTLFNYHHYRFWKKNTCLSIGGKVPMYVRSFHEDNDSATDWHRIRSDEDLRDPARVLFRNFGINILAASFAI